jgi:glycerophosphoryl diester phosphodiesterase
VRRPGPGGPGPPGPGWRRVGHRIVGPGDTLEDLAERVATAGWDMVELDVLEHEGRLWVAHDPAELTHPRPLLFADALRALREALPDHVELDVDIKAVGYEAAVLAELRRCDLVARTLVSTMEAPSLRTLRELAPDLRRGLSVPRARRNYLAHPLTRPGAYAMLAYLRRALPGQVDRVLASGLASAIMAHWGVVTARLVDIVGRHGAELYVWTVDDHRRLSTLQALGATAVITNDAGVFERARLMGEPAG